MGLRINTNIASINAQRNNEARMDQVGQAYERLSSGLRINKAADDAAGMAIATKLNAKVRGLQQVKKNSMDGLSVIQIAEGGLNETNNILIRLRELSVQAASDTVGNTEREYLNLEYDSLISEANRIAHATEFNGVNLLQGQGGNKDVGVLEFQVGTGNNPEVDRFSFDPNHADARPSALQIEGTQVATKADAQRAIDEIDKAIVNVSGMRSRFGALQNRLSSTVRNISISTENMSAVQSRIQDADIAAETSNLAKNNILAQSGSSVLAQANQSGALALKLIG
jgi:flagellin